MILKKQKSNSITDFRAINVIKLGFKITFWEKDDLCIKWNELRHDTNDLSTKWNELRHDTNDLSTKRNELRHDTNNLSTKWNDLRHGTNDLCIKWNELRHGTNDLSTKWNDLSHKSSHYDFLQIYGRFIASDKFKHTYSKTPYFST